MKRISILCSFVCLIAFTQCNKEESMSELIAQEEENYEDLEKIETLWEEGCGKPIDDMSELIKQFQAISETPSKTRLIARNGLKDYAVIRIDANCNNYPTVVLRWDNEDSKPATYIRTFGSSGGNNGWANNGVQTEGSALRWTFCLVPSTGFPTHAAKCSHTWAVLLVDEAVRENFIGTNPNNKIVQRYIDCEDKKPNNWATYAEYNTSAATSFNFSNLRTDLAAKVGKAFRFDANLWLTFMAFTDKHAPYNSIDYFPDLGFSYAVFNNSGSLHNNITLTAEIFSDDEDSSNTNAWNSDNSIDFVRRNTNDLDYDFIKGGGNTTFFINAVDPTYPLHNP